MGNPLFYSLEDIAKPITSKVFTFMKEKSRVGIKKGKRLFTNATPPQEDSVQVKKSSTKKPLGRYTFEEKAFLENILKKAQ